MKHSFASLAGTGLGLTTLGLSLFFLSSHARSERPNSGLKALPSSTDALLLLGFDRSGSYRRFLGGAVAGGSNLAANLDPDTAQVACYALDTQTTELFDNPAPESAEELMGIVSEKLRCLPAAKGTHPASFWRTVAQRAEETHAPTAIALYSDGDDDAAPRSRVLIKAAAKRLARTKNVVFVAVYGVSPDNRAALNADFAPLGRTRFHLYGPQETDTDTLLSCLQQARNR